MSPTKNEVTRRTRLHAVFDRRLSFHLQTIRAELESPGAGDQASESLAALQQAVARLREALETVSARHAGDLAERLDELEYPFQKLQAFFAHKKSALDKRATEIMAEYVRDRMIEIRVVAKALDARP